MRSIEAPAVDEGDAPGVAAFLRDELRSTPGRLTDSLRIVAMVLIVVGIAEVFRLPDIALSAYIVLFLSHREAVSTVLSAVISGVVVGIAIVATIVVFMLSLSEPALRIPLMAITTFAAAFLARTSRLGPVFFTGGFIVAYGLTFGDELLGLSLQPATSDNAPQLELPEIVFASPEEALVLTLLWMSVAAAMPLAVLIAVNLLTGRDPARLLRAALAERLLTAGRVCAGEKRADGELEAQAFEGTVGLHKLHSLAGHLNRSKRVPLPSEPLIEAIGRLDLLLLAWMRLGDDARVALLPAAAFCSLAAQTLRTVAGPPPEPIAVDAAGAARPLADALSRTLDMIAGDLARPNAVAASVKGLVAAQAPRRLLAADSFSNPAHAHFALKLSMAVMICYFIESLANWPSIGTCVPTCFMVALGTTGDTLHKATLRIVGALVGAGLGLAAVLLLMPQMTELGELFLLLAPVTFLAAWIGCGSDRVAYAGFQIGLAFYLVVLHGTGPTVDMYTARDRIIGILLGNVVIFVIFTTIWRVSGASVVRANVAKALAQLAALAELGAGANGSISLRARSEIGIAFGQAIGQARASLVNDRFETSETRRGAPRKIDAAVVVRIGRLSIPVSLMLDLVASPAWRAVPPSTNDTISAYLKVLAEWFRRAESWVLNGAGGADIETNLPEPPLLSDTNDCVAAFAMWSGVLDRDIRGILDDIRPPTKVAVTSRLEGALRVAG